MHTLKTISLAATIGALLLGGCQYIAGVRTDAILDESGVGGGGSGGGGTGGGQPCSGPQDCASSVCNNGFCCVDPPKEEICQDFCGQKISPCGVASVECGCSSPNTCGGAGVPNVCGCVACSVWSKVFGGGTSGVLGADLATDTAGNVLLSGDFGAYINFGGGNINAVGGDTFLAKLDPTGNYGGWAKGFGNANSIYQDATSVAVDGFNNVVMVGKFSGEINFGGGKLTNTNGRDIFVAKFDAAGQHLWSKNFGTTVGQGQNVTGVAVDSMGNVILVGDFTTSLDFGGDALTGAGGPDVFIVKLDPDGTHIWSKSFAYQGDQRATDVAIDGSGNVLVTGYFDTGIDFGGMVGAKMSQGGKDAFIAKLDPGGNLVWAKPLGDGSEQQGYGVAADASGNVLVTGGFQGTLDFGGGMLMSAVNDNVFIAKLDPDGNHTWSKAYGGSELARGRRIAFTNNGDVLVTGDAYGAPDFGGGERPAYGPGIFIARFNAAGTHIWSKGFTNTGNSGESKSLPFAITEDPAGNVIVGGTFVGAFDFGVGSLTSTNSVSSMFVLKMNGL